MGFIDAVDASEEIDRIVALIDEMESEYPHVFVKAKDFLEDVREKVLDVQETIDERDSVTEAQAGAIENWGEAVEKWYPGPRRP